MNHLKNHKFVIVNSVVTSSPWHAVMDDDDVIDFFVVGADVGVMEAPDAPEAPVPPDALEDVDFCFSRC